MVNRETGSHRCTTAVAALKLLCSYGGIILPRRPDGRLRYVGGLTRILAVDRSVSYAELMVKLAEFCGVSVELKCELPGGDLETLVSIKSDEDLANLIEEYDEASLRSRSSSCPPPPPGAPLRIRAVLFEPRSRKQASPLPSLSPSPPAARRVKLQLFSSRVAEARDWRSELLAEDHRRRVVRRRISGGDRSLSRLLQSRTAWSCVRRCSLPPQLLPIVKQGLVQRSSKQGPWKSRKSRFSSSRTLETYRMGRRPLPLPILVAFHFILFFTKFQRTVSCLKQHLGLVDPSLVARSSLLFVP